LELIPTNISNTYKYIEDPKLKANGIEVHFYSAFKVIHKLVISIIKEFGNLQAIVI